MVLSGQAKTDYQREYMRRRRSNRMKPDTLDPLRPHVRPKELDIEPQSHSPMMAGYVPPRQTG